MAVKLTSDAWSACHSSTVTVSAAAPHPQPPKNSPQLLTNLFKGLTLQQPKEHRSIIMSTIASFMPFSLEEARVAIIQVVAPIFQHAIGSVESQATYGHEKLYIAKVIREFLENSANVLTRLQKIPGCSEIKDVEFLQPFLNTATHEKLDAIIEALLQYMPDIEVLDLSRDTPLLPALLTKLKGFTKLHTLKLCDVTDEHMEIVAALPCIKVLTLQRCQGLVQKGYQALSRMTTLRELHYSLHYGYGRESRPIRALFFDEYEAIAKLKGLCVLDMEYLQLEGQTRQLFEGLPELQSLTLSSCNLNEEALEYIDEAKNLRQLSLKSVRMNPLCLLYLAQARTLQELSMKDVRLEGRETQAFKKKELVFLTSLQELRKLSLASSCQGGEALKLLASLKKLTWLDLSSVEVGAGLQYVASLSSLQYLDLTHAGITDEVMPHLSGLSELRELHLGCNNKLTEQGLASIKGCRHLTHLSLRDVQLQGDLACLSGMVKLQHLSLPETGVTDAAIQQVEKRHPELRTLILDSARITDAALSGIAGCRQLRELNLYLASNVTGKGLIGLLSHLPHLRKLELGTIEYSEELLENIGALQELENFYIDNDDLRIGQHLLRMVARMPSLINASGFGMYSDNADNPERKAVVDQFKEILAQRRTALLVQEDD